MKARREVRERVANGKSGKREARGEGERGVVGEGRGGMGVWFWRMWGWGTLRREWKRGRGGANGRGCWGEGRDRE